MARVNPNGGAIALGHPVGATGARLDHHRAARARAHRRPSTRSSRCAAAAGSARARSSSASSLDRARGSAGCPASSPTSGCSPARRRASAARRRRASGRRSRSARPASASRRTTRGTTHADVAGFTTAGPGDGARRSPTRGSSCGARRSGRPARASIAGAHPARQGRTTSRPRATASSPASRSRSPSGQIVEVEAMRGRRLRHLAATLRRRARAREHPARIAFARMTTFGFQIPGFRHAGAPDAEMFDHTVAHARRRRSAAASSRCG